MAAPIDIAGRYRIDRRLGAGGMSTVFLAIDTVLERNVAIKLLAEHLAEDEAFVARFRREALAAARLQHPNVVQVFDSGEDPSSERHYIVMEFVDGPSCANLLRETSELDLEPAVAIARDACHGLDYAHRAGVIHRDVKPGNLLISDETGTTKLADFGIAKAAEQTRITQVGSVLGTAAYLSPEQARGDEAGPESDIYSLGVCIYQFLAGRLPHEYGSLTELALKQQQDAVVPITEYRSDVPPELDRAIRTSLERDPAARYASALEFGEALEAGLHGHETEATRRLASGAVVADDDLDSTQRLAEVTAATQALRTRSVPSQPSRSTSVPTGPRREDRDRRAARRNRTGRVLAALAAVAAIAAVAVALLVDSNDGGGGVDPVSRDSVPQQVEDLKQFIREHSR
jgi:serine/threonine-protein kinase